jgi:hypothetical protein
MPIRPYLKAVDGAVFDPEAVRAMSIAFEGACRALMPDSVLVRRVLAKRITALAAHGERDPDRLRIDALEGLGLADIATQSSTHSDAPTLRRAN